MDQTRRSGLLLILLAAAGYSFFAIFTKFLYENDFSSPLDILVWRFVLAAPLTWLLISFSRRDSGSSTAIPHTLPRLRLVTCGVLFGVVATSAFFSLQTLPVSLYTVLLYTYPALVALGTTLFGERLSGRDWATLGLTLVGIILTVPNIVEVRDFNLSGLAFVAINAVGYAAYIVLSGRLLRHQTHLAEASAWSITGSLVLSLGILVVRGAAVPGTINAWLGLLALAVVSTVIPIFAFYAGMRRLGAARAAIFSTLEPVLTLLWAVILLHENLQPVQILGAIFIIGSVILLQLSRGDTAQAEATPDAKTRVGQVS